MGEKTNRKSTKTAASKTLKEKRVDKADKKAHSERSADVDIVSGIKKR